MRVEPNDLSGRRLVTAIKRTLAEHALCLEDVGDTPVEDWECDILVLAVVLNDSLQEFYALPDEPPTAVSAARGDQMAELEAGRELDAEIGSRR